MRPSLCARDVGLERCAGVKRVPIPRRRAISRDQGGGGVTDQVAGGCFCCRFPDLVDALDRLRAHAPEVIFAEAVGSCTDVAATTVRPLLRDYAAQYRIAPLTVLVHERPEEPELRFLFDLQLAEADLVVDRSVDVEHWLEQLLGGGVRAGGKVIAVDYARYPDEA